MVVDIARQLYYSDVVDPTLRDLNQLETLKAMDVVQKEYMTTFHKQLPICDPSLGPKFMHKVYIHYDMNPELEMFTKKLQMLVSACVTIDYKLFWLEQWNQFGVLKEAQKFPKQDSHKQHLIKGFIEPLFGTMFDFQPCSSSCF